MFGSGASRLRSSDVWTNKQRETRVIAREGAESSFAETENGRLLRTENSPEPGCLWQRRPSQQGPNPRQHWGERAKKNQPRTVGLLKVVVEYSSSANTHPVGVRRAVPGLPPNEEYGVHPRICSNHLTGSGNFVPVRVSIACANTVALAWS